MRNRPTANQESGALGVIGTALLHVGIVVSFMFTWSHRLDILDRSTPVVPVDLVTVAEKTNVAPVAPPTPEKVVPPEPNMIEPTPPPVSEPKIEVAPADIKPPVKPKPEPKKEPKKEQFDINNILASLDKRAPKTANAKPGTHAVKGIGAQNAMTADLASALQSEIYRCWSPPMGAPHPEKLIVTFDLFLNRDGSIAQPPQLTSNSAAAMGGDPYMRAAVEAARRAIYTCAPYKLPADRYSQWQVVEITFDPRLLSGQ